MKVELDVNEKIPINDVPRGATFIHDDDVWMRVHWNSENIPELTEFPDKVTGINLSTGEILPFEDKVQVVLREYMAVRV